MSLAKGHLRKRIIVVMLLLSVNHVIKNSGCPASAVNLDAKHKQILAFCFVLRPYSVTSRQFAELGGEDYIAFWSSTRRISLSSFKCSIFQHSVNIDVLLYFSVFRLLL